MKQTYRIAARENREKLVKGLGWFSIGLGLVEIFAPRTLSRLIGIKPHTGLVRIFGVRELLSGLGILTQPNSADWIDARVAENAADLQSFGFLTAHARSNNTAFATS